ncbi:MAG: S41 family peptidase [Pseudomonadota bacterium]
MKLATLHNYTRHSFARSALAACIFSALTTTVVAAEEPPVAPLAPASETAAANPNDLPLPLDEVRIFAQVLNQIRNSYVEPIDDQTLIENAIKGMLAGIDPHSSYVSNDDFDQLQESTTGEFGGLGVEVGIENGLIKIISPMDDSPASRAGIMPGDLIIKLNDTPAQEVTLGDTTDMLRGAPGTSIRLTILREGVPEPFEVTVTREIIRARSIRYREIEPAYGYVRISQFAAKTGDEVVEALEKMQAETPLKGLVLDLRNNPGGVLQAAVGVVDAFITSGLIVYTEGRIANSAMRFEATPEDPSEGVPLVVLINGGSASASEIVAGALQDHKRGIIMGTQSFGKGSVQTVLNLGNNRAIKLTTSLYFTPDGRSIQATGITPDITVDRGQVTKIPDSIAAYREADLNRHLGNGNVTDTETEGTVPIIAPTAEAATPEVLVEDYQLNEAINVLKGLNILKAKG